MDDKRFITKKSLGQHFLTSDVVPRWMCDAAAITPGELVVEVGPGTGVLTREILARGARVIALEADLRAIEALKVAFPQECADGTLTVFHADIRTFDLSTLLLPSGGYAVVSNIPYYLTGGLFRLFLEHASKPRTLVFLVQKEVAKRITVDLKHGGKESLLSLSVKLYGTPHYIKDVSRGHFSPPPKVDSGIVSITEIKEPALRNMTTAQFFDLLHLGFGKKRKQLLGNLSESYTREHLQSVFASLGLLPTVRAEDIDLSLWIALAEALYGQNLSDVG